MQELEKMEKLIKEFYNEGKSIASWITENAKKYLEKN